MSIIIFLIVTFILRIYFSTLGINISVLSEIEISIKRMVFGETLAIEKQIIWYLQLTEILIVVIAGFDLVISGSAMQGIAPNPIVSIFTIVVLNAAVAGVFLPIVYGFGIMSDTDFGAMASGFCLTSLCTFSVYFMSSVLCTKGLGLWVFGN